MLLGRGDPKDSASQFAAGVGSIVSTAQGSDGEQSAAQQQQGSGFRDVRSYVDVERHIADFVSGPVVQTALRLSQLRGQPHALERPLQATRNRALEALELVVSDQTLASAGSSFSPTGLQIPVSTHAHYPR